MTTITYTKHAPGLYDIVRNGRKIGRTATHPRVFPRHWWATIGDVTATGKTRAEAVARAVERAAP